MAYGDSPRKSTGMKWQVGTVGEAGMVEIAGIGVFTVVSNTDTESPIESRNGKRLYWASIRTLTLANGQVVYGCADCDYAAPSHMQVRPHRNAHRKAKETDSPATAEVVKDVRALLRQADRAVKLEADVAEWKRRALAAERDLSALRQAVGRVMGS